jgi:hypothetical protein
MGLCTTEQAPGPEAVSEAALEPALEMRLNVDATYGFYTGWRGEGGD